LDFPEAPILDGAVDLNRTGVFADPNRFEPNAYCVTEPQLSSGDRPGALIPANWLRPRFRWTPAAGDDLFELRFTHPNERHALVVFTTRPEWTMPAELWTRVATNLHTPIEVTIRGTSTSGGVRGVRGSFSIAPVFPGGTLVFWATSTKTVSKQASRLVGLSVGSEYVASALNLSQVETAGIASEHGGLRDHGKSGFSPGEVQCIGCHVSTPDGSAVVFGDDWPWNKVVANVDPKQGAVGSRPAWLSENALSVLNMPWQSSGTMSPAEWAPGRRVLITSIGTPRRDPFQSDIASGDDYHWPSAKLAWMDLEATTAIPRTSDLSTLNPALSAAEGEAWGYLANTGDPGAAVTPDFSHDGKHIVYTSTVNPANGHLNKKVKTTPADLYVVPFNDRKGGEAKPLLGAAETPAREYYPAYSPDDRYVAFNRVETLTEAPYYNRDGEIWIVPSEGGSATRLAANDPPACTGQRSPGVTNSWAKWSPRPISRNGKTYYFLVFSSTRRHDGQFDLVDPYDGGAVVKSSHLYMASFVVDDATRVITSYPAVYLWNQNRLVENGTATDIRTSNLTPAWDEFRIPPPPPPQ
jgi:hypothetical protein